MKAIKLDKPYTITCEEVKKPIPKKGEALIKVIAAGICGSDIGAFRGTNTLVTYPRVIGHELAGIVESIPADNPRGIKVGDKVVVDPYLYCGTCYPCLIGRTNCCDELRVLGVHVDGGMTEYFCHPASMLVRIPQDMDYTLAAMAEPLTISLHGIHRGGLKSGEYCAIFGAGSIGILAGMAANVYGAHPIIIDVVQERLDFAKKVGIMHTINPMQENLLQAVKAITKGKLCQMIMECSGANACIRSSLDLVCHAGRITLTGWPHKETSLPTDIITRKEIDIRGARTSAGEFQEAVDLIYSGRVDVGALLTKVVSLEEVPTAVIDIEKKPSEFLKVVARMDL